MAPATKLNSRLPQAIENVFSKALEKDADLRYQTAAELRADLKRMKRDLDSSRRPAAEKTAASGVQPAKAGPERKSVAVLYFENQSGGKEDEYFRDGMTEDIITELSKITQLHIFPRSEMLAFRDKPVTATQPDASYDLVVLDAFSSDAVPAHLLTREAIATYIRTLRPGGIVAFHLSNRFYDLAPAVASTAKWR